ncbi:FAD-binding domain-containing protein [Cadophora sp. DSE1049]|nr:FAD-binding domain-containing protein [Cadophora sp. DSE1049]
MDIDSLRPHLSPTASINFATDAEFHTNTERWSTYKPPTPGAVVNVATEEDISATIKWAITNNVQFLARSGAHGSTFTFSALSQAGIVINLRFMNKVTVDLANSKATISAGAITSEVLTAAHAAGAHVATGQCNAVGAITAYLGGGLGNQKAMYGLGVDNMLEARLVTATGDVVVVSEMENKELWWGLRGAGHNFGIVSQLTVKAYEQVNRGLHWSGTLGYPGATENVGKIVGAINTLGFGQGKPMGCTMVWARAPPDFQPMVLVNVWYGGSASLAETTFAPLLSLGPFLNTAAPTPYPGVNSVNDFPSIKDGSKRMIFGTSHFSINPETIVNVFTDWETFTRETPDASHSIVLTEYYDAAKEAEVDIDETAYPWRGRNVYMLAVGQFTDMAYEGKVQEWGARFKSLLVKEEERTVYVNFATGDEDLEMVYGGKERLDRLRALKAKWDPNGAFSYYNAIK